MQSIVCNGNRAYRVGSVSAALDNVAAPDSGARIALVACPGAYAVGMLPMDQSTAIDTDLGRIAEWGASGLVTLVERAELEMLGVRDLGERTRTLGLAWWHLPVIDGAAPGKAFERVWRDAGPALHASLDAGQRIALHCRAGIGRTGTVAARLLVERGMPPADAVAVVRRARPGAIESPEQRAWVDACAAI